MVQRILGLGMLLVCSVAAAQSVPSSSHVWMITEENHSFENVVGNPAMPYYNQLIGQYGLATQFYSNQHTSLPALMWFVAGASVEPDENTVSCNHPQDNIVRELLKSGYHWRSYQEHLPYAGYQGLYGGTNQEYYRRHNPLIDFTDVCPGTGQELNSVPLTQMAQDFAQGDTVNYAYIAPDVDDDAHNGPLDAADRWLAAHVPAILNRPEFQPGGDGILFIAWDEGTLDADRRCSAIVPQGCGGRTATLVIGPQVKPGYQSTVTYHNENLLKTVCVAMGLATCPGAAQDAAPMADFFATSPAGGGATNGVTIASPTAGAIITGPVHLQATASENQTVSQTQVWDNGVKLDTAGTQIDASYALLPGQHTTSVLDLDSSYHEIHHTSVTYTVQGTANGLQVFSPTPGEVVDGVVQVVAHASENEPVSQMQVWDNGVKLGWYNGSDVNQTFTLSPGQHTVTVLDLDSDYGLLHLSSVSYNVQ